MLRIGMVENSFNSIGNEDLTRWIKDLHEKLKLFLLVLCSTREIEPKVITAEISAPLSKIKTLLNSKVIISEENQRMLKEIHHLCGISTEVLDERLRFEQQFS